MRLVPEHMRVDGVDIIHPFVSRADNNLDYTLLQTECALLRRLAEIDIVVLDS